MVFTEVCTGLQGSHPCVTGGQLLVTCSHSAVLQDPSPLTDPVPDHPPKQRPQSHRPLVPYNPYTSQARTSSNTPEPSAGPTSPGTPTRPSRNRGRRRTEDLSPPSVTLPPSRGGDGSRETSSTAKGARTRDLSATPATESTETGSPFGPKTPLRTNPFLVKRNSHDKEFLRRPSWDKPPFWRKVTTDGHDYSQNRFPLFFGLHSKTHGWRAGQDTSCAEPGQE